MKPSHMIILLLSSSALAAWINFPSFLMGGTGFLNLVTTAAYMFAWCFFIVYCRKNFRCMLYSLILGILTFITAFVIVLLGFHVGTFLTMLLASLFSAPFQGLRHILERNATIYTITLFSLVICIVSAVLAKKANNTKYQ